MMSLLEAISPTARVLLAANHKPVPTRNFFMNAEIEITQRQFLALYQDKKNYLAGKPRRFLEDLLHEAEELRHHEEFSVRASAEINRAACVMLLEEAR